MKIQQTIIVPDHLGGMRLDQALAKLLPNYSRTQIQTWIKDNEITLGNKPTKARNLVIGGEIVTLCATLKPQPPWTAQPIDLDIIYEDTSLLVINKPIGMVMHPAAGHGNNTLLNALLHHAPALQQLPRAGILHRLDKDTSGILVIAKTRTALVSLTKQLKARTMKRIYQAIIVGVLISGGSIDQPIGRHPVRRKSMAVIETGKSAITHYRVIERYNDHTRIKVQLETGRTHQIRVHMAYIGHPVFGDQTYGGRLQLPKGATPLLTQKFRQFKRQALHAYELGLVHPVTEKSLTWQASLPEDMCELINILKNDAENRSK